MMEMEPIARLSRDLAASAKTLTDDEARFLVDSYYALQDSRIVADNQVRALGESGEPHSVLAWLAENNSTLEKQVARALDKYSASQPLGEWARSIIGIGPVIAAGLLAHIDMHKAPTVGHVWSFAGLDPRTEWKKGEKRPWNARLKTLCWKIGESFVKVSGNDKSTFGMLYRKRKELEIERNEAGLFADQAAAKLERFKIGKGTDAYKAYSAGKLPPAHIHSRAKRYAVKSFLANYHEAGCHHVLGIEPPVPFIIAHDPQHVHWRKWTDVS
jgi:hypothetical protein